MTISDDDTPPKMFQTQYTFETIPCPMNLENIAEKDIDMHGISIVRWRKWVKAVILCNKETKRTWYDNFRGKNQHIQSTVVWTVWYHHCAWSSWSFSFLSSKIPNTPTVPTCELTVTIQQKLAKCMLRDLSKTIWYGNKKTNNMVNARNVLLLTHYQYE
jgi:hypothetical protein